jgi:hypothetical protein
VIELISEIEGTLLLELGDVLALVNASAVAILLCDVVRGEGERILVEWVDAMDGRTANG